MSTATLSSYSSSLKMYPTYVPSPPEKYNPYSIHNKHTSPVGSLPSIETLLPPSPNSTYLSCLPEKKIVPLDQPLSIITDEAYLNSYYDPYYQLPPVQENGHRLLQCAQKADAIETPTSAVEKGK